MSSLEFNRGTLGCFNVSVDDAESMGILVDGTCDLPEDGKGIRVGHEMLFSEDCPQVMIAERKDQEGLLLGPFAVAEIQYGKNIGVAKRLPSWKVLEGFGGC